MLREDYEMKEEIKNPKNAVQYTTLRRWKHIVSFLTKILRTKILVLKKLNKID